MPTCSTACAAATATSSARARGEELEHAVLDAAAGHAAVVAERAPEHLQHVLVAEAGQLVHARARQQRGVHLEVRVLGRRADERQQALLDGREQRVLLSL